MKDARRNVRVLVALASTIALVIPLLACGFGADHAAQIRTLAQVCDGTPAPGAPAYAPGPGEHPIMALQRSRSGTWSQSFGMLTTRTPSGHDVASTQLVLCIDAAQDVELGRCDFDTQLRVGLLRVPGTRMDGPSFPRVRVDQRVRVVATASAQTIGESVLSGSEPPACDRSIVGDPSDSDFRGGDVPDTVINAWAEPYGLGTAP